ncbi:MAG TPA: WcaI family glycosyltransferase [Polyangia bacterium]|nr:WcaI family glycosyltransferase [Polyangia bacterium]
MAVRRILIVAVNYWPEPTGTAPYTTGLAEHLVTRDWEVKVVTTMPYYPTSSVFAEYRSAAWRKELVNGVRILRGRPYVLNRQTAFARALLEASFLLSSGPLIAGAAPDLVLGISPGISSALLALAAARIYRVPLALWIQDLLGAGAIQSGVPGGQTIGSAATLVEGWIARQADRIAIISQSFRPYLAAAGVSADRISRIRNWTHIGRATRSREAVRADFGLGSSDWICLHAGNMGYKQGLENIVDCARLAQSVAPDLTFVLLGDGNQRAMLEERGRHLPNLRFLPTQSNEQFANALAMADVLLVNQRASVTSMSLPSKLTSYLAADRPIVAAVSSGEVASLLTEVGAGAVVPPESPAALLEQLVSLRRQPTLAAEMAARGAEYARTVLSPGQTLTALERFVGGQDDRGSPV